MAMIQQIRNRLKNLISDEKFSDILSGSAWALSARVISTALAMVVNIIVARFYGAEMLGIVTVLNSFLMITTIFTVLGTGTSIMRLIPEHLIKYSPTSAFKLYRNTQWLVIAISLVTGTFFFLSASLIAEKVFNKPNLSYYLGLASLCIIFKSLMQLNTQAIRGLKLIRVYALMQALPQGLTLLLLLLLGFLISAESNPVYAMLGGIVLTSAGGGGGHGVCI